MWSRKTASVSLVDDEQTITLCGNRQPLAIPKPDARAVSPDSRRDRMRLSLQPDAAQQDALLRLLDAQHDSESDNYPQSRLRKLVAEYFGGEDLNRGAFSPGIRR